VSRSPTESTVLAWSLKVGNNVVLFRGNVGPVSWLLSYMKSGTHL
jgi:hypothetical protein